MGAGISARVGAVRILLAEDDVRLADVLAQALGEAGWDVEVVADGARRRHRSPVQR